MGEYGSRSAAREKSCRGALPVIQPKVSQRSWRSGRASTQRRPRDILATVERCLPGDTMRLRVAVLRLVPRGQPSYRLIQSL